MNTAAKKRTNKKSHAARKSSRDNSRRGRSRKISLPKTAAIRSRKSKAHRKMSRADSNMSLTELQNMAKSKGVPFGGLTRSRLVKKINHYI